MAGLLLCILVNVFRITSGFLRVFQIDVFPFCLVLCSLHPFCSPSSFCTPSFPLSRLLSLSDFLFLFFQFFFLSFHLFSLPSLFSLSLTLPLLAFLLLSLISTLPVSSRFSSPVFLSSTSLTFCSLTRPPSRFLPFSHF